MLALEGLAYENRRVIEMLVCECACTLSLSLCVHIHIKTHTRTHVFTQLGYEDRRVIEMLATEPSSPGATECLLRCLQRHATHRPLQVTEVSLNSCVK